MARIVSSSASDIAIAASHVRAGGLIGMPTETVYGLGANALDQGAAVRVFEVKGRPQTDPLIVHVTDYEAAFSNLWNVDAATLSLARSLAVELWPGPLTMVATAAECVPPCVTGMSGFVGIRVPNHPVARAIIDAAGVPICAPSANLFGHVSPTTAEHVFADLADRDPTLIIVDGGACAIGVESTVVKIVSPTNIEILRRGRVSADDIVQALHHRGLDQTVAVTVRDTRSKYTKRETPPPEGAAAAVVPFATPSLHEQSTLPMDGPGQMLTHYAPRIPAFLVTPASLESLQEGVIGAWDLVSGGTRFRGEDVLVLDFAAMLRSLHVGCKEVRSLSSSGSAEEACREVFDALRWSETVDGAKCVCMPLVTEWPHVAGSLSASDIALLEAVEDRLFRAASGRVAQCLLR